MAFRSFFFKYIITTSFIKLFKESFSGCDWTNATWNCCSIRHPCSLFEGDCDHDYECLGNLLCGTDNCFNLFPSEADCCYDPDDAIAMKDPLSDCSFKQWVSKE